MTDHDLRVDEWGEAHGGLRGSRLLRVGAILALFSLAVETGSRIFVPDLEQGPWGVTASAWLGWITSLGILGLGFLWIGMNPVLTRFGIAVGIFHLLHAVFLLVQIFTEFHLAIPPRTMAVGRLVLVLLFAIQERQYLGVRGSRLLTGAAAVVLAKTLAAVWSFPSGLGAVGGALWDFVPAVLLVLALYHTGALISLREDAWAEAFLANRGTGFEDFNNPLNRHDRPER
ncbi:MAG: hypothetical protein GY838_19075 [bacterium]|nr:hypothetical protein [bacterium]